MSAGLCSPVLVPQPNRQHAVLLNPVTGPVSVSPGLFDAGLLVPGSSCSHGSSPGSGSGHQLDVHGSEAGTARRRTRSYSQSQLYTTQAQLCEYQRQRCFNSLAPPRNHLIPARKIILRLVILLLIYVRSLSSISFSHFSAIASSSHLATFTYLLHL